MVQLISNIVRSNFVSKKCIPDVKLQKYIYQQLSSSNQFSFNLTRNYSKHHHQSSILETTKKYEFQRFKIFPANFRTRNGLIVSLSSTRNCQRNSSSVCCDWNMSSEWDTKLHNSRSILRRKIDDSSSGKLRPSTPSIFDTMNQPLTVCVEGNIGSGKTTFLEYFKKYEEVCVFDEPISKWRDCQGYNLLDLMYKDPKKWSMCFQSYVQLTMLDLHTKPIEQPIKMMERSIYSAQYCFVKNLHTAGLLEEVQYSVLNEWFQFSTKNIPIKLDLIVYLRTDPEVAFARTNKRGRSEENSISLEYIQSVHNLHEDWLVDKKHLLPCPVLTLDANTALEEMAHNYDECRRSMFQKVAVAN